MNKTKKFNYINNMNFEYICETSFDSDITELNILDYKPLVNIECNNNSFISKKAIIDNKLNKRLTVVNDYENFYYLSEKKKGQDSLYSNININVLKNKRFPTLKLETPLNFVNLKNEKSLKENILTKFNKKESKNAIILNSTKSGFNIFYKGIIGFITKDQMLKGLKVEISYNGMLLFKKENVISKTKVSNCLMNIYFQTIKHNFSKTKRRRINFVETGFVFNNKKYEKNRKNIKTKNNK
jgi:hypothetical protein